MFRNQYEAIRPELIHVDYLRRRLGPAVRGTKAADAPLLFLKGRLPDWIIRRLLKIDWANSDLALAHGVVERMKRLHPLLATRTGDVSIRAIGGDELHHRLVLTLFSALRGKLQHRPILEIARLVLRELSYTWAPEDTAYRRHEFTWGGGFDAIGGLIQSTAEQELINICDFDVDAILYTHDRLLHWLGLHGTKEQEFEARQRLARLKIDELVSKRQQAERVRNQLTEQGSRPNRAAIPISTIMIADAIRLDRNSQADRRELFALVDPAIATPALHSTTSLNSKLIDQRAQLPLRKTITSSPPTSEKKSNRGRRAVELTYETAQRIWWDLSDDVAPSTPSQRELCERLTEHGIPMSERTFRNRKNVWQKAGRQWPPSRPTDEAGERQEFVAA